MPFVPDPFSDLAINIIEKATLQFRHDGDAAETATANAAAIEVGAINDFPMNVTKREVIEYQDGDDYFLRASTTDAAMTRDQYFSSTDRFFEVFF